MANIVEPTDGQEWRDYKRGDLVYVHRLGGDCEFYRYDKVTDRVQLFDRYGLMKEVLPQELGVYGFR